MRALRIGVVGTGFAASSHVEALRRVPGATLAGVAASSPEKGEQAAAALAAERAFRDWRELIADPSVEVVHNCTPNDLHYEVNAATLEAGKHLLSEKPLALNASETAALAERAASAGVVAGVCFNYRHYPLVGELKELLAESDGSPHLVRGAYLQDWLLEETDWNWRVEPERAGASRAVGDIGSHWLDLAEHVTGDRVIAVCAELGRIHAERLRPSGASETFVRTGSEHAERVAVETEDFATALLRFASGCRGVLTVSQVTAGRKNRLLLEVDTARESFAWDQEEPNTLWIGRRDAPNAELPRDPTLLSEAAARLAHYPGGHQEGWPDGLKNLLADFYGAVAAHEAGEAYAPSFATFADAHRTMRLVEAILESDRAGGWVTIGERTGVAA